MGLVDPTGSRYWNATEACCNFYDTGVDDAAYLMSLVDEISAKLNIDESLIYFTGHSNGGFMGFNLACHYSDRIAGVFAIAGTMYKNKSECNPTSPVNVLHIHGTNDQVNKWDGGFNYDNSYSSVQETVSDWIEFNGCSLNYT